MNQEPVLIKGVVAFPNPNGNREIRFIDAFYHDLFKIPDHSSIVINYLDGGKRCVPCEYIDDTHVDIDGTAFHICQFAELMMRNGATYEPEHPQQSRPTALMKSIKSRMWAGWTTALWDMNEPRSSLTPAITGASMRICCRRT